MHPSLRLSVLEVLPFTIRRIAISAAGGNLKDVQNIHRRIKVDSYDAASVFIPVFHACLDVARIPGEELLDVPSTFTEGAVPCAEISLRGLYSMVINFGDPIHRDAIPDLWPRLWAWVQFADTYRERFPDEGAAGSEFINLVSAFTNFYKPQLATTAGLRRVIVGAWGPILRCGHPLRTAFGIEVLTTTLFSVLKLRNRADVDEMIQGAGGSLTNLADLVVEYLARITYDGGTPQLPDNREHRLDGTIFDFINDVDRVMAQGTGDRTTLGPFTSALLSRAVVPALTEMLKTLLPTATTQLPPLLHRSLVALNQLLLGAPGRKATMDALHAGLLQVIILSGTSSEFDPPVKSLVENILQSTLLNYYELLFLENHLPAAAALTLQTKPFQNSAVRDSWNQFAALASERIAILRTVDKESRPKACDNAQCHRIDISAHFQRCSGCLSFYYCSPECQRLDWHDGDHRSHCRYHPQRLSEMQGLKARERSFLRAVMTHDYDEAKQTQRFQPDTPFFTLFDYRRGPVRIEMQSMDSPLAKSLEKNSGWRNDVLRAARSSGRMELQVLVLPGHGRCIFVVPCARRNSLKTIV
ncbi:hypothetical protein DFH06DRAFT_1487374 [Mycena polygramma]|nr:hypothetical protein DFH06DRAFT_1487374 [Mycena polygramma]